MPTKILVLGATGMLGNAIMRALFDSEDGYRVFGTMRSSSGLRHFSSIPRERFVTDLNVQNQEEVVALLSSLRPDVVINCVGLVKQHADASDPLAALSINSMLPHRLAGLCALMGARLIHVSTDCVFDGAKGGYIESDPSDARDLYGKTKFLGEVAAPHITLRTSIIGHELDSTRSLIGWFLSQEGTIQGYTRAVFSGLPTIELANVIRDYVLPNPGLSGLYHVAAAPISKHDLLTLVSKAYGKSIKIIPDDDFALDRSLNGDRFTKATGYRAPSWPELVAKMQAFK